MSFLVPVVDTVVDHNTCTEEGLVVPHQARMAQNLVGYLQIEEGVMVEVVVDVMMRMLQLFPSTL